MRDGWRWCAIRPVAAGAWGLLEMLQGSADGAGLAVRRVLGAGLAIAVFGLATTAQGAESPLGVMVDPVTVLGRGSPRIQLLDRLGADALTTYGVDSASQLLSRLTGELAGADGSGPLVLVDGRRVGSLSELADLPTESLQRVDLMRETEAVRRGGRPGQKVVNIVLRPRSRSLVFNFARGWSTDGGGRTAEGGLALTRVHGGERLSLVAQFSSSDRLLESERDLRPTPTGYDVVGNVFAIPGRPGGEIDQTLSALAGGLVTVAGAPAGTERPSLADFAARANVANVSDLGRFRSLLPEQRRSALGATLTHQLAQGWSLTVKAGLSGESARVLNGLAAETLILPAGNPYSPFANDVALGRYYGDPLAQTVRATGAHVATTVNADLGRWTASLRGEYGYRQTRTRTDRGGQTDLVQAKLAAGDPTLNPFGPLTGSLLGSRRRDEAQSRLRTDGMVFVLAGPAFRMPAGDLTLNVQAAASRSSLTARLTGDGPAETGRRSRRDAGAWLNIEAPLTRSGEGVGSVIGDLSAEFNASVRSVSDIGTLHGSMYGLNWTPRARIVLSAAVKRDQQPPTLFQLASPRVETTGVPQFDYVNGASVELVQVSGGNPALRPERRDTLKLGIELMPLSAGRLRLSADYARVRIRDAVSALPAATLDAQTAFPERFVRGADGTLVRIDARWVNLSREDREQLRWGLVFRQSAQPAGPGNTGGGVGGLAFRVSLHHTWVFDDKVVLRPGSPAIDRLRGGGAASSVGGQPRHIVQWEVDLNRRGLGANLSGAWQSATRVPGGRDALDDLRFSPLSQHDVRLYADLGERLPRRPWAQGVRLSLTVINVFNERQRVRDAQGATPPAYQPAYLDPLGRTVTVGLRKRFA